MVNTLKERIANCAGAGILALGLAGMFGSYYNIDYNRYMLNQELNLNGEYKLNLREPEKWSEETHKYVSSGGKATIGFLLSTVIALGGAGLKNEAERRWLNKTDKILWEER